MNGKQKVKMCYQECLEKLKSMNCELDGPVNIRQLLVEQSNLIINQNKTFRNSLELFQEEFERKNGLEARINFNKLLVYELYLSNCDEMLNKNLPDNVKDLLIEDFSRIIKIADDGKKELLTVENYMFLSYLEELCFRKFPLGNQSVNISGYSRALIFKQHPLDVIKFLLVFGSSCGNRPFFELHYNPHRFRQFNYKGWVDVFRLGGEMLLLQPEIKGIIGASWFYDPALKKISPELSYLREIVLEIGGHFFFESCSKKDKKNAFAMSRVRRMAFERSEYLPTSYLAIIPRKPLLKWCRCFKNESRNSIGSI